MPDEASAGPVVAGPDAEEIICAVSFGEYTMHQCADGSWWWNDTPMEDIGAETMAEMLQQLLVAFAMTWQRHYDDGYHRRGHVSAGIEVTKKPKEGVKDDG